MKHEQRVKLSPHEQNQWIATLIGWTHFKYIPATSQDSRSYKCEGFCGKPPGVYLYDNYEKIPDYLNDLNAMHEAEMTMNEKQFHDYIFVLYKIFHAEKGDRSKCFPPNRTVMCATAAQRAEAFVLTMEG